jgi:hypothetical protein
MSGANFLDKNFRKQPIVETLNATEIKATIDNADLRKKLRVDRARKMVMGTSGPKHGSALEDPN